MKKPPIIVIDFETTGTFEEGKWPTPIEIGAVKIDQNKLEIIDTFESLIYTTGIIDKISDFIINYTGITKEMLLSHGEHLNPVLHKLNLFCEGKQSVIAAWPISYEIPLLQFLYAQEGFPEFPLSRRAIDIGTLFRFSKYYSEHMKAPSLDVAINACGVTCSARHRALPDAKAEAELLIQLMRENYE
jgi:DNA polymerase III alpha subunit (gram-positive type)